MDDLQVDLNAGTATALAGSGTTTVALVDDHRMVRHALCSLLAHEDDIEVCAEAGDGRGALLVARQHRPCVMVLDIGLPDQGALELVSRLRRVAPEVAILIFSGHAELDYAGLLVREGARAYLHKSCDPADLVRAIRVLARGGRYITPAVAEAMARQMTREAGMAPHLYLSRREFQLFLKLAQGMTISQAADALCLSVKTATSYRTRLMAKMAMRSNHQLTYYALKSALMG